MYPARMEADQIEEEADEQMAAWGFKPKGRGNGHKLDTKTNARG